MKKILILSLVCIASIYCEESSYSIYDGNLLHSFIRSSGNEASDWLKFVLNDQGYLIKADLEHTSRSKPKTPLCAAALLGQVDTVETLLKAKFGPNLKSKVNPNSGFKRYNPAFGILTTTPVLPALARANIDESKKLEIFKRFFKHHADANLKDETGRNALMVLLALSKTDKEAKKLPIVKLLFRKSVLTEEDKIRVLEDRASFLKKEQERLLAAEALRIEKKRAAEEFDKKILADTKRRCLRQELDRFKINNPGL